MKPMDDKLNIYECDHLIKQIEAKADMNDGEVSEEDMKAIVLAQTRSIEQLGKLVNYVKYLEGFEVIAKAEINRIQAKRKTAANRIDSIRRWLRPYIEQHGPITIATHRISTRKSQGVVLADGFNNPEYGTTETIFKADKKLIKESIQNGIEVKGAILEDRVNVQIK
jgi:hypothetical protein